MEEKNKYYYGIASFMERHKENTRGVFRFTVESSGEKFPLMHTIREIAKKGIAIPSTITIDNVIEISEEDYNGHKEWLDSLDKEVRNDHQ